VIPTSPTRAKADLGRLQPDWNLCGNNERTVTNTPWSFPFTRDPQSKTNDQHFRHGLVSASAPPHAGLETRSTPRATPHPNATNAKSQTPSHKRQVTNAKSQTPSHRCHASRCSPRFASNAPTGKGRTMGAHSDHTHLNMSSYDLP